MFFKEALPQNISQSSYIGLNKSLNLVGFQRFFKNICRVSIFYYFLVPETMSPLHVQSQVCMASLRVRSEVCIAHIYVWSKVCIAHIYVQSKVCQFAPHMDGSNADFAPHMEGSHADFAPHMDWRHNFRDQNFSRIAISANF